ncbi:Calcineurin-like phosphoesterase [Globisporangium polare]
MAMGATRSRVHDGYALVSDSEDSLLSTEIPRHHMKQQQHTLCRPATSKLRDAVVLIALVAALCVGFASVIWEPHQLAFTFKRHELRHDSSKQVNASAANAAGGEGVVSGKAARLRAHDKSLREQFVFRESDQGTPFDVSLELKTWPKLIEDGGDLVVLWKAASDAVVQKEDLLTLSCGPTNSSGDFLQKKNVTETDATPYSVRFSDLYMMRCNYVVKYFGFQPSDGTFTLLQQLEVGMKDSFNAPKHGHLALTEKDDEMAIMFNSASSRTPQARYGLSVSSLTSHAEGSSTTYKASDMCHAPATTTSQQFFRDPGFMHTVVMTRLQPDEVYYYQYGNDQDGWSHTRSFRSKPKTGAQETANFIAYADMGVDGAPAAQSTAARVFVDVAGGGYDSFLLHFGDISYARGEGSVWDKFFHLIEPYATRTPYMVSIGNHEYDYMSGGDQDPSGAAGPSGHGFHPTWGNYGADSNGECSVPMHHRWHVPATGNSIYWYSFDYAGVHVVQISTEHDWTRGSEQYEWLKRDLEGVDRSVTPWVVLTAHRMMYSTQLGMESDMTVAKHFRSEVEDLLYQNRVNLMLVGHQHAYERSCPVYKGECVDDEKAPVHIVVGSAGFELDTTDFSPQYGNWSVRHANEYGYLRVSAAPDALKLQFVLNRNGAVYDEFTIQPWA